MIGFVIDMSIVNVVQTRNITRGNNSAAKIDPEVLSPYLHLATTSTYEYWHQISAHVGAFFAGPLSHEGVVKKALAAWQSLEFSSSWPSGKNDDN